MLLKLYSLYDKKAETYGIPMFVNNQVEAMRALDKAVNTVGSLVNLYASDFALYYIGDFDTDSSKFLMPVVPKLEFEAFHFLKDSEEAKTCFSSSEESSGPAAEKRQVRSV